MEKIATTATKLLHSTSAKFSTMSTNKYFLYFTAFLAITTVFGYLATNKFKAVIFFGMVSLVVSKITPNMSVVLLIAVLATNLLVSMRTFREGMEDTTTTSTDSTEIEDTNADVEDKMTPEQRKALAVVKTTPSIKDAKIKMYKGNAVIASSNVEEDEEDEEDVPEAMTSMTKSQNNAKGASSRIDYASTLENAYSNLEGALGAGGIKELTKDTSKLMAQQKELFQSMQQMGPLIEDAKSMMKGFDMKSLSGLASLATGVEQKK